MSSVASATHLPLRARIAPEKAPNERQHVSHCERCRAEGIIQAAHRIMPDGRRLCAKHYEAFTLPVAGPRNADQGILPIAAWTREKPANNEVPVKQDARYCACGCNTKLRKSNTTGYYRDHALKGGEQMPRQPKAEPQAGTRERSKRTLKQRPAGNKARRQSGQSNGTLTVRVTPEFLDAVWNAMSVEKKAALISRLNEL